MSKENFNTPFVPAEQFGHAERMLLAGLSEVYSRYVVEVLEEIQKSGSQIDPIVQTEKLYLSMKIPIPENIPSYFDRVEATMFISGVPRVLRKTTLEDIKAAKLTEATAGRPAPAPTTIEEVKVQV